MGRESVSDLVDKLRAFRDELAMALCFVCHEQLWSATRTLCPPCWLRSKVGTMSSRPKKPKRDVLAETLADMRGPPVRGSGRRSGRAPRVGYGTDGGLVGVRRSARRW